MTLLVYCPYGNKQANKLGLRRFRVKSYSHYSHFSFAEIATSHFSEAEIATTKAYKNKATTHQMLTEKSTDTDITDNTKASSGTEIAPTPAAFIPPSKLKDAAILAAKRGEINWRELVVDPRDDLRSLPSTAPGRPRTFLKEPHLGTAPFSCEIIKFGETENGCIYSKLLLPLSRFLRAGAGVKVILDDYRLPAPAAEGFDWSFYLDDEHPDFHRMSSVQRSHLELLHLPSSSTEFFFEVQDTMSFSKVDNLEVASLFSSKSHFSFAEIAKKRKNETIGVSIEESWMVMVEAASQGVSVAFDLSPLRPHGIVNSKNLMASGPIGLGRDEPEGKKACSFFSIYKTLSEYLQAPTVEKFLVLLGTINDTLRRGGFKRGIITTSMNWRNPLFEEYLDVPLEKLPGGHKKGARLTEDFIESAPPKLVDKLILKRNTESVFIAKIFPKFYDNVCMGLGVPNFGTCLIWRLNLGKVDVMSDIPGWMVRVASQLTLLHLNWRSERPGVADFTAPQEQDLQIGLDIMGMANALARWGISYHAFNEAIKEFLLDPQKFETIKSTFDNQARRLVYWLAQGYKESTKECDRICDLYLTPRFERIHTASEPAQSHSYETKDITGHTTCRAIYPPIGKRTRKGVKVRRVSDHQENVVANHGFVETVATVSPELCYEFSVNFNAFVDKVGRSHKYFSLDTYQEMNLPFLKSFLQDSRVYSLYYSEYKNYHQKYLSKAAPVLGSLKRSQDEELPVCGLSKDECSSCSE